MAALETLDPDKVLNTMKHSLFSTPGASCMLFRMASQLYQSTGKRGAVTIINENGVSEHCGYSSLERVIEQAGDSSDAKRMVESYDPEKEAVVICVVNYIGNDGQIRNKFDTHKISESKANSN